MVGSDYFPSTFAKAFGTLMHEAFENINKKMSGSGSAYVADTYKEELTELVKGSIERTPELNAAFEKLEKDTGISFATLQGLIGNGFNFADENISGINKLSKNDRAKILNMFGANGTSAGDDLLNYVYNTLGGRLVAAEKTIYGI